MVGFFSFWSFWELIALQIIKNCFQITVKLSCCGWFSVASLKQYSLNNLDSAVDNEVPTLFMASLNGKCQSLMEHLKKES